jgi:RNA polymerase sigma-70 factor (ECF subfamily)
MKDEQLSPDSEWMRSLVDAHAADLTRYAASILGDHEGAKDVVQESFIRLWREPRREIEDHVRPWLFRVCRNCALDQRRKGGRMRPLNEVDTATRPAEGKGPEETAEQQDSHAQVIRLMNKLPENQREVVRLKFQNDLSYKEIAGITELSVSNVGFLLHTALKTLRAQVAATGE